MIIPYERIFEARTAPLYHGYENITFAKRALKENRMRGNTTQRFWPDGKKRKNNDPEYKNSFWMKGISFSRDFEYSKEWGFVVFELDQQKLINNYKIIPFDWGSFTPNRDWKNAGMEREEFLILEKIYNTQKNIPHKFWGGTLSKKSLDNLENYLTGIYLDSILIGNFNPESNSYLSHHTKDTKFFIKHPKFKGWYSKHKTGLINPIIATQYPTEM